MGVLRVTPFCFTHPFTTGFSVHSASSASYTLKTQTEFSVLTCGLLTLHHRHSAEVPGSSHLLSVIASSISLFLYFLLELFYGQFLPQRMLSLLYTHSHSPALPLCVSSRGSTGNSNKHSLALHSTSVSKKHIPPTAA